MAPQLATHVLMHMAATFNWEAAVFDIGSAFLTGEDNARELYVRPPREGLPGVPDGSLVMLTKGVFGLKEAPRLWWLKFAKTLADCGWKPLRTVPGVFVIHVGGILKGMLAVHVDDGLWAGAGKEYEAARAKVREKLNVK